MRRLLQAASLLIALFSTSAATAQELYIPARLEHTLKLLSSSLDAEMIVCLEGTIQPNGNGMVDGLTLALLENHSMFGAMPYNAPACDPSSIGVWHNHPYMPEYGVTTEYVCALSGSDIVLATSQKVPFMVVQVEDKHQCYWNLSQIEPAFGLSYLGAIAGQTKGFQVK